LLVLTDFVVSSLKGKRDGSPGLERSVNPWDAQKKIRTLKGCETARTSKGDLASHQDAFTNLSVPGIYALLQSLATFSNPIGIMAAIVTTTKSVSFIRFEIDWQNPQFVLTDAADK
jgi:hypothetical protein